MTKFMGGTMRHSMLTGLTLEDAALATNLIKFVLYVTRPVESEGGDLSEFELLVGTPGTKKAIDAWSQVFRDSSDKYYILSQPIQFLGSNANQNQVAAGIAIVDGAEFDNVIYYCDFEEEITFKDALSQATVLVEISVDHTGDIGKATIVDGN